jgi:hypothetical protein
MKRVVVIGGCVEDVLATGKAGVRIEMGTSNPGKVTTSSGGVARNIAETIGRLGGCVHVQLVTVVGEDDAGRGLLEHARLAGVDVSLSSIVKDMRTARCMIWHTRRHFLYKELCDFWHWEANHAWERSQIIILLWQFDPVKPVTKFIFGNPLTSKMTFLQIRGNFAGQRWRPVRRSGRHGNI